MFTRTLVHQYSIDYCSNIFPNDKALLVFFPTPPRSDQNPTDDISIGEHICLTMNEPFEWKILTGYFNVMLSHNIPKKSAHAGSYLYSDILPQRFSIGLSVNWVPIFRNGLRLVLFLTSIWSNVISIIKVIK